VLVRCWTPHPLASAFCARDRRIEQSASFKHGTADVEQTIANCAEGAVTSGTESGVPGPAGRVVLYRDTCPIEKGVAQAPVAGAPA
jgi:hypothetical protein